MELYWRKVAIFYQNSVSIKADSDVRILILKQLCTKKITFCILGSSCRALSLVAAQAEMNKLGFRGTHLGEGIPLVVFSSLYEGQMLNGGVACWFGSWL